MEHSVKASVPFWRHLLLPILGSLILLSIPVMLLSQAELRPPTNPFEGESELIEFTLEAPSGSPHTSSAAAMQPAAQLDWQTIYSTTFPANDLGPLNSVSRNPALPNHRWGIGNVSGTGTAPFGVWTEGARAVTTFGSGETYTDSVDAWLIYGPIDGDNIWNAVMEFDYFNRSQPGDYLVVGYSTDGTNFTGYRTSGLMNDWNHARMEWETGRRPQIWVAFGFQSNADGLVEQGAWVDNLVFQANYGGKSYLPAVVRDYPPTATPTPTPTPVPGFKDDFSNPNSGWPRAVYNRGTSPDGPVLDVNYDNNTYRMKILLEYTTRNNRRMGVIPAPYTNPYSRYDISVDHFFVQASDQVTVPTDGKGGLIFAANSNYSTIFVVEWNYQGNCAVTKYENVTRPTSVYTPPLQSTIIMGWKSCTSLGMRTGYNQVNRFTVEVRDNQAFVYLNNGSKVKLVEFTDNLLRSTRNVGLINGSYDWTPVEGRYDNFEVQAAP